VFTVCKTHVTGSAKLLLQDASTVKCRGKREPVAVNFRGAFWSFTSVSAFFSVSTTVFSTVVGASSI